MPSPGEIATLGTWDYIVIAAVFLVSTGIGIYYASVGGRQRTAKEFLLADRNMNPFPVALSLMATYISAITVLGTPAEVYVHGTMYWTVCFALVFSGVIIWRTFIPIFYEHEITSTNEYLERRFNRYVRYLATALFFLQTLLYVGIVIYAPALALNAVTGLNLWGSVVAIGVICTFYTSIGGLKAVVWTDVFQAAIMTAGLLAVVIQGSIKRGGLRKAWEIAESRDRIQFWNFNLDPTIRHTFWSLAVGQTFFWTKNNGVNQAQVQRYLSCGKKSTAQIALGLSMVGVVIFLCITCVAGVVMFAYYADCDPLTMGYITAGDQLLPYFVMELFGDRPGLPGLFTACVFSAALSSVSSSLNAFVTIAGEDVIKSIWPDISPIRYTISTKVLGLFFGGLAMLTSFLASQYGAVLEASLTVSGLVGGPIFALFCLGIFFPCVNSYGAGFGSIVGLAASAWLGIGAKLYPPPSYRLSLSTEKCYVNATSVPDILATTHVLLTTHGDLLSSPASAPNNQYPTIASFYSISYAWFAAFSWAVSIVFGLLISFATGHNKPSEADVTLHRPIVDSFLCCLPGGCTGVCRCGVPKSEKTLPSSVEIGEKEHQSEKMKASDLANLNAEDAYTKL